MGSNGSTFTSDATAAIQADHHNMLLQQQLLEEQSQHSMDNVYATFSVVNGVPTIITQDMQFAEDVDVPDVPMIQVPQLPSQDEPLADIKVKSPEEEKKTSRMDELNDLAMLGIDADDLAAQCI